MFSSTSFAEHDFTYKNVFACGPKVVKSIPWGWRRMNYYVIHENEQGNEFSIYRNQYEYSSFKKIHYTDLYVQVGGERWLTFQEISDSIIRFEFHLLNKTQKSSLVSVLTFDVLGMSAVVKHTWSDADPDLLVCWKY
jgi:hypothetical protein